MKRLVEKCVIWDTTSVIKPPREAQLMLRKIWGDKKEIFFSYSARLKKDLPVVLQTVNLKVVLATQCSAGWRCARTEETLWHNQRCLFTHQFHLKSSWQPLPDKELSRTDGGERSHAILIVELCKILSSTDVWSHLKELNIATEHR